MMIMSSFLMFMFMYVISFILIMMSSDWFLVWLGLEINMISFIVMIYQCSNMYNIESCLKYFFVQSLSSALLLGLFYMYNNFMHFMTFVILSMSIGAGPFYFWFPAVCMGLGWYSCYMIMIFQSIIPLMLMIMFISMIMWPIVMFSLILGAMGSFNQNDLKRFMAYSSVHHLGWILVCMMINDNMWILYLVLYNFVLINVLFMFNYYNLVNINMMSKCKSKFFLILGILSMGGMPPMLGFFLKWMVFSELINLDYMLMMYMLLMSLVMFYVYFRIMYEMIIMGGMFKGWLNFNKEESLISVDIMSMMGLLMGIFILLFLN